jgi:hypothetical protein
MTVFFMVDIRDVETFVTLGKISFCDGFDKNELRTPFPHEGGANRLSRVASQLLLLRPHSGSQS